MRVKDMQGEGKIDLLEFFLATVLVSKIIYDKKIHLLFWICDKTLMAK